MPVRRRTAIHAGVKYTPRDPGLKRCPIDGKPAELGPDVDLWSVRCTDPACNIAVTDETPETAKRRWNHRVDDHRDVCEACGDVIEDGVGRYWADGVRTCGPCTKDCEAEERKTRRAH